MSHLAVLALLVTGCSSGITPMKPTPAVCTTHEECHAHDGERVEIVGIYTVWEPRADIPPERSKSRLVKVRFDGASSGPFLAAENAQVYKRSLDEIAQFRGKRVRVIGTFLREIPQRNDDSAQLGGACISAIESITVAE